MNHVLDKLWRQVVADRTTTNTNGKGVRKKMLTETQKAQEVSDAYNALKATVAADKATITQLQTAIANGTPATADQLGALGIMDTLDEEVEADGAAAAAGSASSPAAGGGAAPAASDTSAPAAATS
jgi:hypothetical protein